LLAPSLGVFLSTCVRLHLLSCSFSVLRDNRVPLFSMSTRVSSLNLDFCSQRSGSVFGPPPNASLLVSFFEGGCLPFLVSSPKSVRAATSFPFQIPVEPNLLSVHPRSTRTHLYAPASSFPPLFVLNALGLLPLTAVKVVHPLGALPPLLRRKHFRNFPVPMCGSSLSFFAAFSLKA